MSAVGEANAIYSRWFWHLFALSQAADVSKEIQHLPEIQNDWLDKVFEIRLRANLSYKLIASLPI